MLIEVLILSFISILSLMGSYFIGSALDAVRWIPRSRKTISRVYFRCVYGILLLVSIHAIAATLGRTIFSLSFVVFGFLVFNVKKNSENAAKPITIRDMLIDGIWLLIPALVFPLAMLVQLFYLSADHLEPDLLFYAKIAEFIDKSGENMFHGFQYANEDFSGMSPYHYFEMWFVNFFQRISPFTSIVLLKYFAYPFFKSMIVLGILSIVSNQEQSFFKDLIWAVLIFGLTLLPIEPILNFIGTSSGWGGSGNIWLRPNLVFYVVFALPTLILAMEKRYREAILISLFIPLVSITTAPSYFVVSVLVSFYFIWNKKEGSWWRVLYSTFFVASLVMLQYLFFGTPYKVLTHSVVELMIEQFAIIKAIIGAVFFLTMQVLLVSSILLVSAYYFFERLRPLVVVCGMLSFCGILLFQTFPLVDNTYQFPYFGYAMLNLLFIIIVSNIIVNHNWKPALAAILLSAFFISSFARFELDFNSFGTSKSIADYKLKKMGYSENAIAEIANYLSNDDRIAFTVDKPHLQTMFQGKRRHFLTMQLGAELSYKFQRLRFYPIVLPHVLYCCPENDPSYAKPRAFNDSLEYYSEFVDDEFYTLNYLNANKVHWILRNTLQRLSYDPYYEDQGISVFLRKGVYIVPI